MAGGSSPSSGFLSLEFSSPLSAGPHPILGTQARQCAAVTTDLKT
jgi:hypothetical protein